MINGSNKLIVTQQWYCMTILLWREKHIPRPDWTKNSGNAVGRNFKFEGDHMILPLPYGKTAGTMQVPNVQNEPYLGTICRDNPDIVASSRALSESR